jgi:hypothetical protein
MAKLRISNTAVYTSDFTPTTQPLTANNNTLLLMFNEANTSNYTTNFGSRAITPTMVGTVPFNYQSPNNDQPCGSILFNGTSQYLTVPANTVFATGTGNFTVEAWLYHNGSAPGGGVTTDRFIFGGFTTSPSQVFFLTNNTLAPALWDGTTQFTGTSGITPNTWSHVAWVRSSNVLSFYINGVNVGPSVTSITTDFTSTRTNFIGRNDTTTDRYFPGYITNLRFVKGTAVYTGNFTPPTTVLPVIPNTSFLLRVANTSTFITDSSNNALTVTNVNTALYKQFAPLAN